MKNGEVLNSMYFWGNQGLCGSVENVFLYSGSWRALVIIFRDLGSKFIVLGIKGALQKCKNKISP